MRSLVWTFLLLGAVLAAGYVLFRMLAAPARSSGTGTVLAPVNGALGWVNQALNTVDKAGSVASDTAGAADRILTSAENIYNRFSTFGQSGDTGDN